MPDGSNKLKFFGLKTFVRAYAEFNRINRFFQRNFFGPERGRTADLLVANEALYQLSYRPEIVG